MNVGSKSYKEYARNYCPSIKNAVTHALKFNFLNRRTLSSMPLRVYKDSNTAQKNGLTIVVNV